jgi:hypothetical protein
MRLRAIRERVLNRQVSNTIEHQGTNRWCGRGLAAAYPYGRRRDSRAWTQPVGVGGGLQKNLAGMLSASRRAASRKLSGTMAGSECLPSQSRK